MYVYVYSSEFRCNVEKYVNGARVKRFAIWDLGAGIVLHAPCEGMDAKWSTTHLQFFTF